MGQAAQAPSGTRDFLSDELRRRKAAMDAVAAVFERYGFDPMETPAFERMEVLTGKYGEEASQLLFKILKRGVHEASGEADLALRYDHTVPLARVIGTHGGRLPSPFKRYVIGPVWRADRPQEGRFREFVQCDVDTVGSSSPLADAEILWALNDGLEALGVSGFRFLLNSRNTLFGLLEVHGIGEKFGASVLGVLDKIDKVGAEAVASELVDLGVPVNSAEPLVADVAADDPDRLRARLRGDERGERGLAEIDRMLDLARGLPEGRIVFTPRMVRGLDYYTGCIFEANAEGYPGSIAGGGRYDQLVASLGGADTPACGGSIGIERIVAGQLDSRAQSRGLDVALTVLDGVAELWELAAQLRTRDLRVGTYLGTSSKLGKQLKWANEAQARLTVLFGAEEAAAGEVTVRDMASGEQTRVTLAAAADHISAVLAAQG